MARSRPATTSTLLRNPTVELTRDVLRPYLGYIKEPDIDQMLGIFPEGTQVCGLVGLEGGGISFYAPVTQTVAKRIVHEYNRTNRPIHTKHVSALRKSMENGDFRYSSIMAAFCAGGTASDGRMVDGLIDAQHRIYAYADADKKKVPEEVKVICHFGLPAEDIYKLDRGMVRKDVTSAGLGPIGGPGSFIVAMLALDLPAVQRGYAARTIVHYFDADNFAEFPILKSSIFSDIKRSVRGCHFSNGTHAAVLAVLKKLKNEGELTEAALQYIEEAVVWMKTGQGKAPSAAVRNLHNLCMNDERQSKERRALIFSAAFHAFQIKNRSVKFSGATETARKQAQLELMSVFDDLLKPLM